MNQEMRDLLELAGLGDVQNVVAAIVQIVAGPADRAQRGVAGDDAGQRDRFLRRGLMSVMSISSYRWPAARWTATGAAWRQSKMPWDECCRAALDRP